MTKVHRMSDEKSGRQFDTQSSSQQADTVRILPDDSPTDATTARQQSDTSSTRRGSLYAPSPAQPYTGTQSYMPVPTSQTPRSAPYDAEPVTTVQVAEQPPNTGQV